MSQKIAILQEEKKLTKNSIYTQVSYRIRYFTYKETGRPLTESDNFEKALIRTSTAKS
jgi:hypothetical protein